MVIEYRDGRLNEHFKQNLIDRGYNLYVRSNDRQYFGLGAQYAYTYNAPKLTTKENFKYFRGAVDMSGNMLGLLSKTFNFSEDQDGRKLLFGVPYLQYVKGEIDFRWYRFLGGNRQLVFRVNSGVALPYGNNSQLLIFEKSFFAGGMNGIRAWQARTLGPGGYNRDVLDSDIRVNLRNLDQLGEIKFESNVEYRFRIMNDFFGAKLNGASFLDVGNVWRLRKNDLNPNGEFSANKILTHMAVGTGFRITGRSRLFCDSVRCWVESQRSPVSRGKSMGYSAPFQFQNFQTGLCPKSLSGSIQFRTVQFRRGYAVLK